VEVGQEIFGWWNASMFVDEVFSEAVMEKLFIGNIPHSCSEPELQQWVEAGGFRVQQTEIIRDAASSESRGFGFVLLKEGWKAKDAVTDLNGRKLRGRRLAIMEAFPPSLRDRTI
jgi:hypothetical protein